MSNQIPQTEIDRIKGQANLYATGSAELYEAVYRANYDGRLSEYLHRSSASPEPERAETENNAAPFFKGTFRVINGELDFVCLTNGVPYETVKAGLIKLKDEIERQLANEQKCPYYKPSPSSTPTALERVEKNPDQLPCICSQVGTHPGCSPGCTFPKCGPQPTTSGEEKTPDEIYREECERQLKAIRAVLAGESPSFDESNLRACLAAEKKLVAYWKGKAEGLETPAIPTESEVEQNGFALFVKQTFAIDKASKDFLSYKRGARTGEMFYLPQLESANERIASLTKELEELKISPLESIRNKLQVSGELFIANASIAEQSKEIASLTAERDEMRDTLASISKNLHPTAEDFEFINEILRRHDQTKTHE